MLELLLLLVCARIQEMFDDPAPVWQWALGYVLLSSALNASVGILIFKLIILLPYLCFYFSLMRRTSDHVFLWLCVWLGGAFLPMFIGLALLKS